MVNLFYNKWYRFSIYSGNIKFDSKGKLNWKKSYFWENKKNIELEYGRNCEGCLWMMEVWDS